MPWSSPKRRRPAGRSCSSASEGSPDAEGRGAAACLFRRKDGLMATTETTVTGEIAHQPTPRQPYDRRDFTLIGGALAAAGVCALAANLLRLPRLQPLTGLIVIMTIAYSLSTNRRAIDRRTVAW